MITSMSASSLANQSFFLSDHCTRQSTCFVVPKYTSATENPLQKDGQVVTICHLSAISQWVHFVALLSTLSQFSSHHHHHLMDFGSQSWASLAAADDDGDDTDQHTKLAQL